MLNFLTFDKFITQDILIFLYYIGAVIVPFLLWKQLKKGDKNFKFLHYANQKNRLILLIIFILAELLWRMIFEAMIGYFDIHDYLQTIMILQQNKI